MPNPGDDSGIAMEQAARSEVVDKEEEVGFFCFVLFCFVLFVVRKV